MILVVEDEAPLAEVLRYNLEGEGFRVTVAPDGRTAMEKLEESPPDLVVLDWMLPEVSGLEICRTMRRRPELRDVPVIMLTAKGEEHDRVRGLDAGADDYVVKPFSPKELVARVRAVLRRAAPPEAAAPPSPELALGRIRLDPVEHRIRVDDTELAFTVTEFAILKALLGRPGKVYTRDELTDLAYGENYHLSDRTLDSHVRRIRAHFRAFDLDPIETVHGLGYRLRKA